MSCPRGAAAPNLHTQRKLFAASGGFCQNPACNLELFVELPENEFHVAEMAHVFAAGDRGPRANANLSAKVRGSFENLMLLCSLCHTMIDKAPKAYPDTMILGWKRDHASRLRSVFGVRKHDNRVDARTAVEPLFRENRSIFDLYGPHIEDARNPESGAAERWKRKVLSRIVPNNRKLLAHLDANLHLLTVAETSMLERFRQHVDDFEAVHLLDFREGASRFPEGMDQILKSS